MNAAERNLHEVHRFLNIRPGPRHRRIGWILIAVCTAILGFVFAQGYEFGRRSGGTLLYTTLDRGYKLVPGSPVLLADVQVGEVDDLVLRYNPIRIDMTLRIYKPYRNSIPAGTEAGIGAENIFQSAITLFPPLPDTGAAPGASMAMLKDGDRIPSRPGRDIMVEAQTMIEHVTKELGGALEEVHRFTQRLNDTGGEYRLFAGKMIEGSERFSEATDTLKRGVSSSHSVAGLVLHDSVAAARVRNAIEEHERLVTTASPRVDRITRNLDLATEGMPRLVASADSAVGDFRGLMDQASHSWIFGGGRRREETPGTVFRGSGDTDTAETAAAPAPPPARRRR